MNEQLKTTTADQKTQISPEKWLEIFKKQRTDWQLHTISKSWKDVHYLRHHQLTGNEQLDIRYGGEDPRDDRTWKLFTITPKKHPKETLFGNRFQPVLDENFQDYLLQQLAAFSVDPSFPNDKKINLEFSFPKSPLEANILKKHQPPTVPVGFDKTFNEYQIELDFFGENKNHLFIYGGKRSENVAASIATSLAIQASPDELVITTLSDMPHEITESLSQLPHFSPNFSSVDSTDKLNENLSKLTLIMEKRKLADTPPTRHILILINNVDRYMENKQFLQNLTRLGKGGKQQNIMVIASFEDYDPTTVNLVETALTGAPEGKITTLFLKDFDHTSAYLNTPEHPPNLSIVPILLDQVSLNFAAKFANNKWPRRKTLEENLNTKAGKP